MQEFKTVEELKNAEDNYVVFDKNIVMDNSFVRISGKNNILFFENGIKLSGCQIKFNGSNSVVYISSNKHITRLNIDIYNNSVLFIGKNNYMNGVLNVTISEQKNVVIGSNNLFAFGIWIRTADPHLVYSAETMKRINPSKSVFLGDHVWIGQNVFVLKGTKMHSGSILGAGSVCAGKEIGSNTSYAGNPVRKISSGIFWDEACVHSYNDEKTKQSNTFSDDKHIFAYSPNEYTPFNKIDEQLSEVKTSDEKLEYLKKLSENNNKNRFAFFEQEQRKRAKKSLFKTRQAR